MKTTLIIERLTQDLKNSIKDCLISIAWKKDDLIRILKDCNFTSKDLAGLNSVQQSKSQIIDIAFDNVSLRADQGVIQVRSIIETIINWSDFSSYFWTNGSLNKEQAQIKIENLKKLIGHKTERDKELQAKKEREERLKKEQQKPKFLSDLNSRFSELCKMNEFSQKRGYELEKLLCDVFRFFEIDVCNPFKLQGEQIDGSFNFHNQNYIFEARWQSKESAVSGLYTFTFKIESNSLYPRGVFFSMGGYSDEALARICHNKKPQLILIDAMDLTAVLEGRIEMAKLLSRKIEYAQTKGKIYANILELI